MSAPGQLGLDLAAADPGRWLWSGGPCPMAKECRCDPPAVFAGEDGPTCAKCGRAP